MFYATISFCEVQKYESFVVYSSEMFQQTVENF